MEGVFKSYITDIFVISICAGICEFLLDSTAMRSKTLENGLKLAVSMCLCVCVLLPALKYADQLFTLKKSLPTFSYNGDDSAENAEDLESLLKEQLKNDICNKIYEKFGIQPDSVCIDFVRRQDTDKSFYASADITLGEEYLYAKQDIKEYANQHLGINITVNGE